MDSHTVLHAPSEEQARIWLNIQAKEARKKFRKDPRAPSVRRNHVPTSGKFRLAWLKTNSRLGPLPDRFYPRKRGHRREPSARRPGREGLSRPAPALCCQQSEGKSRMMDAFYRRSGDLPFGPESTRHGAWCLTFQNMIYIGIYHKR
jgi:hypothetical protein